jgi:hypothetical protein
MHLPSLAGFTLQNSKKKTANISIFCCALLTSRC